MKRENISEDLAYSNVLNILPFRSVVNVRFPIMVEYEISMNGFMGVLSSDIIGKLSLIPIVGRINILLNGLILKTNPIALVWCPINDIND